MPTQEKVAAVAEIKEKFSNSKSAVLTDYRGLSVEQMAALRRDLRKDGIEYHVFKNTLTKIAAAELELSELDQLLEGPTAIAFATQDPIRPAKLLYDFARKSGILKLKGTLLEGKVYDAEATRMLASLPSRDQLIAKLLGTMNGPIGGLVRVMNGPVAAFARVVNAIAQQKGAGAEPAPAEPAVEAPAVEAAAPAMEPEVEATAPAVEAPETEATAPAAEAPEVEEAAAEVEAPEAAEAAPSEEAPAEDALPEAAPTEQAPAQD
jgi:large subunit ribosomal protein L10